MGGRMKFEKLNKFGTFLLIGAFLMIAYQGCMKQQEVKPDQPVVLEPAPSPEPAPVASPTPVVLKADWSNQAWTEMLAKHLDTYGGEMLKVVPADVASYCPRFKDLSMAERKAFYVMLISSLARFESGFKPETTYKEAFKDSRGNYVISTGLLQISLESGRGYECPITKTDDLKDPSTNLQCGVLIARRWIVNDRTIASASSPWRGMARYWSPFRKAERKAAMQAKTKALGFCR